MKAYSFLVSGEEMRTKNISEFELMRICAGGGVEAFPSGAIVHFLDKNEAIKAKERLEAKGIELWSDDVFEVDNPYIEEDKE